MKTSLDLEIFSSHQLNELCEKYHIDQIALFGSFAKGLATPDSDVDLLVQFRQPISLFTFVKVEDEFAELLGKPVDLVTKGGLSPYLKDEILSSSKVVYEV